MTQSAPRTRADQPTRADRDRREAKPRIEIEHVRASQARTTALLSPPRPGRPARRGTGRLRAASTQPGRRPAIQSSSLVFASGYKWLLRRRRMRRMTR